LSRFAFLKWYYKIAEIVYPSLVWRVKNADTVFLTFDDGPHPEITPWVLDELDKFNHKATFFVVGENADSYPEVIEQILNRGHSIGNHTYNHLSGWKTDAKVYLSNIEKCANGRYENSLFRPPYGKIRSSVIRKLPDYKIIMWNLLTHDYRRNLDIEKVKSRIERDTQKGDIIVFHDSEKSVENLKSILPNYLQFLDSNNLISKAL
jgi:peptidoglycan/xylan/chitin deacetylase (PgdA/CDA1 family)